jgi:hypothetical protein
MPRKIEERTTHFFNERSRSSFHIFIVYTHPHLSFVNLHHPPILYLAFIYTYIYIGLFPPIIMVLSSVVSLLPVVLEYWVPVLGAGFALHMIGFLAHAFLGYHNNDFNQKQSGNLRRAVSKLSPGQYFVGDMCQSDKKDDIDVHAFLFVRTPNMPMTMMMIYNLLMCMTHAILAIIVLKRYQISDEQQFEFVTIFVFLLEVFGHGRYVVWYGASVTVWLKSCFDAVLYGLACATVFKYTL